MSYIFLSYSKADRDSAFAMRDVLRQEGFRVWMDENVHDLAEQQWPIIEENIRNAVAFVILVSDAAKESAWVKRELDFAESIQKAILPILIQGEAWAGFAEKAIPLHLGLRLDIPDERIAEIKSLLKNQPDSPLPPPLPDAKLQAQRQKRFIVWLGLITLIVISVIRLAMNYETLIPERTERATWTPVFDVELALTDLELKQVGTEAAATDLAYRATASDIALWNVFGTELAAANETNAPRLMTVTQLALTDSNALTAQAGNGVLPCRASFRPENGTFRISVFAAPTLVATSWLLEYTSFTFSSRLVVSEWIVNNDGVWYRIATEGQVNDGYALGEHLMLDENCPR